MLYLLVSTYLIFSVLLLYNYYLCHSIVKKNAELKGLAFTFKDNDLLYHNLLVVTLVGFLLIGVIFYVIISKVTRPLSQLADSTKAVASGNFDIRLPYNDDQDEVGRLTRSMQTMIDRLKVYFLKMREEERFEGELKAARDIQNMIIPRNYPAFPQISAIDVYGKVQQAKEVGGDFFDYLLYKERYLIFTIGDASGKGFPAALLMTIVRTLFKVNATSINSGHIASKINKELCVGNESNMFVTMFIGVLDSKTGILRYTNAGHNYPLLKNADGSLSELKKTHGIPLGMLDTLIYHYDKVYLSPNQTLILYTDGINESSRGGARFFGVDGVKKYLQELSSLESAQGITTGLFDCAKSYASGYEEYADDVSVLSIKYVGSNTLMEQIDGSLNDIRGFQRNLFRFCAAYHIPKALVMKLNLAIEEILINIVNHACPEKKQQTIYIQLTCESSEFKAVIKNAGIAFDVTKELQRKAEEEDILRIGGWGLFLVGQIMDRIEYTRTGDFNVISLFKKISGYEIRN